MNKAQEYLDQYVKYAEDTSAEGMNEEWPLSVEVNGKYVDILFTTGGPHFEIQLEFYDSGAAEDWYDEEPVRGTAIYRDWSVGEACLIGGWDARTLAHALTREPSSDEGE